MSGCPESKAGWEQRYRAHDTPWDLGGPHPALAHVLEALDGPRAVFVPGAGHGHDALAFAAAGHDVTAVDIAPTALARLGARAAATGAGVRAVEGDVLDLPARFEDAFDLVFEHTCFCALEPADRPAYARAMARALRPDGRLAAVLWHHGEAGGPPYDISETTARACFEQVFTIASSEPLAVCAQGRRGEFLMWMRPRVTAP
jgi:SAM-dependent methyltransferase